MIENITASIDHFVLGVNNLETGIKEFFEKTGVQPVFGGVHEKLGTHNALVSLGSGTYLEILAPLDPEAGKNTGFGTFDFPSLKPIGWVVGLVNSPALLPQFEKHQVPNTGIQPLSRKTSDGGEIKWTNIFHLSDGTMSLNPFFIEWEEGGTHPSEVTPKGCSLSNFIVNATKDEGLIPLLKSLPVELQFASKENLPNGQILSLDLNTPNGLVRF